MGQNLASIPTLNGSLRNSPILKQGEMRQHQLLKWSLHSEIFLRRLLAVGEGMVCSWHYFFYNKWKNLK